MKIFLKDEKEINDAQLTELREIPADPKKMNWEQITKLVSTLNNILNEEQNPQVISKQASTISRFMTGILMQIIPNVFLPSQPNEIISNDYLENINLIVQFMAKTTGK